MFDLEELTVEAIQSVKPVKGVTVIAREEMTSVRNQREVCITYFTCFGAPFGQEIVPCDYPDDEYVEICD